MSKHGNPDHGPAAHASPGAPAAHAAHGEAHGAAHDHPTRTTFVTVWLVLAFLTVVEVFVPTVYASPWNQQTKMLLLVTLATGKALLVAAYFMHLKWESPWVRRIALLPAYMGGAAALLMIEEHFRPMLS
jgi:cytochrome c oxidase subunit 4